MKYLINYHGMTSIIESNSLGEAIDNATDSLLKYEQQIFGKSNVNRSEILLHLEVREATWLDQHWYNAMMSWQ